MAELLIKAGDNAPHKDLMLSLRASEAGAREAWIERESETQERYLSKGRGNRNRGKRIAAVMADWDAAVNNTYRQGDIVKVRPDGWEWGNREGWPRFYVVRVPDGVLDALGMRWGGLQPQIRELREELDYWRPIPGADPVFDMPVERVILARRRWNIPDLRGVREDRITEILGGRSEQRTKPQPFDSAKFMPHNSAGTYTIRSSGGDYTDISDWDAGEASDLVTEGAGDSVAECYDDWASGLDDYINIGTDWTCNSSNLPHVTVASGHRHDGTAESAFFVKSTRNADDPWLYLAASHYKESWMEVQCSACQYRSNSNIHDVSNNSRVATVEFGLYHTYGGNKVDHGSNFTWQACCFYDLTGSYIRGGVLKNCTVYSDGWAQSGDILIGRGTYYNTVAAGTNSYSYGIFYIGAGDYNASTDGSADGANSLTNLSLADIDFESTTGGSEDLHIGEDSLLLGEGSASYTPATDIDGESWESPPAIGWDEVVSAVTYTATASLSASRQTLSGTATHTPPSFTGEAALAASSQTLVASGATVRPVYTGTAALESGAQTLSGTAVHAPPTFTGTAALSTVAQTVEATAAHTAPVYTATTDLAAASQTLAASALHTRPTFEATADLAVAPQSLTASASHVAPVYSAAASLGSAPQTLTATASYDAGTFTATAELTSASQVLEAAAAHVTPTFTATAVLSASAQTLAGTGAFTEPTFTAAAPLAASAQVLSANATFVGPVFAGIAALVSRAQTITCEATYEVRRVAGPYRVVAAQCYTAGVSVGLVHAAGPTAARIHAAGPEAGQIT